MSLRGEVLLGNDLIHVSIELNRERNRGIKMRVE